MTDADLFRDAIQIVAHWQTAGALASVLAAVHLLIRASKTVRGQAILARVSGPRPWLRPLVAAGLGALAGGLGALAGGQGLGGALAAGVMGLIGGLGAVGFHEAARGLTKDGRAEAAAKRAVLAVVGAGDAEIAEKVSALKRELDVAAVLPDRALRLKALARVANDHPPRSKP